MTDRQALTDEVLERLERLEREGTSGEWGVGICRVHGDCAAVHFPGYPDDYSNIENLSVRNAHLIAEARNHLPALLAEIRALRTERQQAEERERRLREVLGECQWAGVSYVEWEPEWGYCPVCGRQRNKGHKDDCEVALALAEGKERQG